MKKTGCLIAILFLTGVLAGCQNPTGYGTAEPQAAVTQQERESAPQEDPTAEVPSASHDVFAMDTYMTITCYGEQCEAAAAAAEEEIHRLDDLLSVGKEDSEISQINLTGSGILSDDTRVMVETSLDLFQGTEGAFDITVYPLMELWGFTSGQYQVPQEAALSDVLRTVGSEKLSYADGRLTLSEAQGIDLGGIAKGYTSDRLMELFASYDLVSGMISLGGNVELYRTKPDGSLWKCGIQDPHQEETGTALMGVLETQDCAVITSGAYERYFTDENGRTYHHIVDPKTGYPANNGLISATIVSRNGMLADGLSTSCYVMGLDRAIDYWKTADDEFDMILMTDGDEVYITENLKDRFNTDYPLHVIEK